MDIAVIRIAIILIDRNIASQIRRYHNFIFERFGGYIFAAD
jgi:hypothetical protein